MSKTDLVSLERKTNTILKKQPGDTMKKITPFLWFDGNPLEVASFYVSIFGNATILVQHLQYPQSVRIQLEGQELIIFNGGPNYQLTPATSLFVSCATQAEIDELWEKLLEGGGKPSRCGWLQDKYGLSWQLVPPILGEYLQDPDHAKAKRVMDAMLQMNKLDIATLERAYLGE
jgi:predicted 3-demethylubiquinone-9 3-methyltransferase (glyoxalase superfamily)